MIMVKNLKIFLLFILVKIGLENVFKDILASKKVFLDYERRKLEKRRKIGIFPYRIVHDFGEEFETFRCF